MIESTCLPVVKNQTSHLKDKNESVILEKSSIKTVHRWEILNFSSLISKLSINQEKESPRFNVLPNANRDWSLIFYQLIKGEFVDVEMFLKYSGAEPVRAKFNIWRIRNDDTKVLACQQTTPVTFNTDFMLGQPVFLKDNNFADFLVNDTFTVECEIEVDATSFYRELNEKHHVWETFCNFEKLENFEVYLNNQKFSDVKFTLKSKEIHAHKVVLAYNSKVFCKMFEHAEGSKDNTVIIRDIDYDIFMEMLRYMYTGKVNDIKRKWERLLYAAHKYSVRGLKSMCEKCATEMLCNQNVFKYYKLSQTYKLNKLRSEILELILCNGKELVKHPDFHVITQLNNDTVLELITELLLNV